jgi:hypothetical protein
MRTPTVMFLAGLAAGCSFGMTAQKFRPTESPRGVEAVIAVTDLEFVGELIEIRDAGFVLLSERWTVPIPNGTRATKERRLRLIPYAVVRRSRFEQMDPGVFFGGGRAPTTDGRERLRLVSRFPQGLSPGVLSQLLKEHGQAELAGVEP